MKKSDNNKINRNYFRKIICFITAAALAIACFYSDGFNMKSYAAGTTGGTVSKEGTVYSCGGVGGTATFTLTSSGSVFTLSYIDSGSGSPQTVTVSSGETIRANSDAKVVIDGSANTNVNLYCMNGCSIDIEGDNVGNITNNGGTVYISGSNGGDINNYAGSELHISGVVQGNELYNVSKVYINTSQDAFNFTTLNNTNESAEIYVNDFTLTSAFTGTGDLYADNLVIDGCTAGITLHVDQSLTVEYGTNYGPIIYLDEDTLVTSNGGGFTYTTSSTGSPYYHSADEWFEDKTASWISKDEAIVSSDVPDFFYGTTYNVMNYVTENTSGGAVTVMFADPIDSDNYGEKYSTPPTEPGIHRAYFTVAETDTYRDAETNDDFEIKYLTTGDDANMTASISGSYVDGGSYRYYSTPVTVTPNSNFKIKMTSLAEERSFEDVGTIDKDGYYNGIIGIFKRKSDDAESADTYITYNPFYIDQTPPEIIKSSVVDENGNTPDVDPVDGAEFHAKKIELDIHDIWDNEDYELYDNALSYVSVNGEEISITDGIAHVVMSTPKGVKTYEIVAKDYVGNVFSATFTIEYVKDVPETSLSMADSYYGAAVASPVVTTDSDQEEGKYKFYYKEKGASDDSYSEQEPFEPGSYTVKVEIPPTDYYSSTSAEADFSISYLDTPKVPYTVSGTEGKNGYFTSDVSLTAPEGYQIADWSGYDFGDSIKYDESLSKVYLKRNSDGAMTNSISVSKVWIDKDAPFIPDKAYDSDGYEIDISEGTVVKANSLKFTVTDDNLASVSVNGEEYEVSEGKSEVYIPAKSGESLDIGIYAEDEAGNNDKRTIKLEYGIKKVPTASVSLADYYVGQDYEPAFNSDSDGKVVFEYKYQSADDSSYSTTKPFAAGKYTVRATTPETDEYKGYSCTDDFELSYLAAPKDAYTLTGKQGNNDYYITDVYVNAPDGFAVASAFRGSYAHSVLYTDSGQKIYLKRTADGALTDAVTVVEKCKIDKDSPIFRKSDNGGELSDKTSVFADEYTVSASDEHLALFTVDGSKVSGGSATLNPENGIKSFVLKAEDEAGNTASLSITLMATWLKDKIIPADKILPLQVQESYKLSSGYWSVNGDSTVYTGGGEVYVKNDGDYTFTKVK